MTLIRRWAIDNEILLEVSIRKRLLSILYGIIFGEAIGISSQTAAQGIICFGEEEINIANSVLDNLIDSTVCDKKNIKNIDGNNLVKRIAPIVILFGEDKNFVYMKSFLEKYLKIANISVSEMLGIIIYMELMYRLFHYDDYERSLEKTALACKEHLTGSVYENSLLEYNCVFDRKNNLSPKIESGKDIFPYCLSASMFCCRNNNSFEKALFAVSDFSTHGGIIGAITGAMAGIYYQIDNIPGGWINGLGRKEDIDSLLEKHYNFYKKYNRKGWIA